MYQQTKYAFTADNVVPEWVSKFDVAMTYVQPLVKASQPTQALRLF